MTARLIFEYRLRSAVLPATPCPMPVCTIVATVPVSTAAVENADPWTGGAYDDDRAVGSADTRGSSMEACATSLPGFGWDDCQRACRGNRRNGQYKNLLMITSQSERSRRIERALHARPRAFRRNDLNFFGVATSNASSQSTNSACRVFFFDLQQ